MMPRLQAAILSSRSAVLAQASIVDGIVRSDCLAVMGAAKNVLGLDK